MNISYTEINDLHLSVYGISSFFDIVQLTVSNNLNSGAACTAVLVNSNSEWIDPYDAGNSVFYDGDSAIDYNTLIGKDCSVYLSANDNNTDLMFRGVIIGTAITKQTGANTFIDRVCVTIAPYINTLDTIPVASMSLVTVAAGVSIQKSDFMTMNERSLAQHTDAGNGLMHINVAKFIQQIIDGVCFEDKERTTHNMLIAGGSAGIGDVVDTSTCPEMSIIPGADNKIANDISNTVLSMLAQGHTYSSVFSSLCSIFYLAQAVDLSTGKTKILPDVGWRKKASYTLGKEEILSLQQSFYGKGRNEVDAVIVGFTEAGGDESTLDPSPEGRVVYGEGIGANKQPRAITDPKELEDTSVSVPRKYITIMLPTWISHFSQPVKEGSNREIQTVSDPQDPVCTSFDGASMYDNNQIRWASAIARATFAQLNRAKATCAIHVPLEVYLKVAKYLGYIIKVEYPDTGSYGDALSGTFFYGRLAATNLDIIIGPQDINIQCVLRLEHVRDEKTNDALGIEDCIYVDNW